MPEIKAIGDGQVCIVPYSSIKDLKYGFNMVDDNAMDLLTNLKRCRFIPYDSYKAISSCTEIMLVAKIIVDNKNSCLINNSSDDNMSLCFSEAIRIKDGCFSPISNPYKNCARRIKISSINLNKKILNNVSMYYLKDYNTDYFFVVYLISLNESFNDILDEKQEDAFITTAKLERHYNNLSYIDKIIATEILYNEYHK